MAANKLVQARVDGAIKEEAAAVLAAMGLTVSDAVRLLLTSACQKTPVFQKTTLPKCHAGGANLRLVDLRHGNIRSSMMKTCCLADFRTRLSPDPSSQTR